MNKDFFTIKGLGGKRALKGSISVNGAKNAILPLMASSIIFQDRVSFTNVPDIEDVHRMIELLEEIGILSAYKSGEIKMACKSKIKWVLHGEIAKRFRASILLTGPLLARVGKTTFPHPGGCVIGVRPIDLFIEGFKKMGAKISVKGKNYKISAKKLSGANIFFKRQSVTGTETFVIAGVLAEGETVLENCAMEPEIETLCNFLNSCGADIKGVGTTTLKIKGTGGKLLKANGLSFKNIPDRLEAGSFLIIGALSAEDLIIENCEPKHLSSLIEILKASGVSIKVGENFLKVKGKQGKIFKSFDIVTHEYPGFPTDLQSPIVVFLTQTKGEGTVFETIFEGRLNYTDDLVKMGADIKMWSPQKVLVKGPTPLKAKELASPDIRAGLAFIIAGIVAEGESKIHNAYFVDRGYESIEKRLQKIGVDIKRNK